jgi:hypothetical protein
MCTCMCKRDTYVYMNVSERKRERRAREVYMNVCMYVYEGVPNLSVPNCT